MRRKDFVLSWGRKIFFGMGWALTSLVALNYFRSMIIPQTFGGWFYYLLTFVGHYGMMLSLVYFILYCPIVRLFPTYYVSRLWSAILLLLLNVFIFLDGHLFSKYRFHLNSFLFDLLREGNGKEVLGLTQPALIMLGVTVFILFLIIWIRGERIWRSMQGRFSNPVKNWYLVLILLSFIGSHLFHMYGDAKGAKNITKISLLFPMNFPLTSKGFLRSRGMIDNAISSKDQGYKDFYYPASKISCANVGASNIVIVTFDGWMTDDFNGIHMPQAWHVSNHGTTFTNHYSGGNNTLEGLFSLYYSLPPAYSSSAVSEKKEPVFTSEVTKSAYDLISVDRSKVLKNFIPGRELEVEGFIDFLKARRSEDAAAPFLANVHFDGNSTAVERDSFIQSLANALHTGKLVDSTIVILTGTHGKNNLSIKSLNVPLVVIWPDRDPGIIEKVTSHYDIIPTLMKEEWKCKNKLSDFSFGQSLFGKEERSILIAGDYQELGIIDYDQRTITTIGEFAGLQVKDFNLRPYPRDKMNDEKILNTLEELTFFFRRH